jgi:magnesium transporter
MEKTDQSTTPQEKVFFLSEIIKKKVLVRNRKVGKLVDLVILETEKIPEVTHLVIGRPFGYPSLLVPWEKVTDVRKSGIGVNLDQVEKFEGEPLESQILLKDHILDKKVLDFDDNEVDVVYDVKLVQRNGKLYVSEVDFSPYGLLRRIGLKKLADFIYSLAAKIREETISWTYIQPLPPNLTGFAGHVKLKVLKETLNDIHPVDLADILEELDPDHRLAIFKELNTEQASDTLEEIEPRVQRELISSIKIERAAELINDMTPAQAADILTILPASEADEILKLMDSENARKIEFMLDKHEENILNFATSDFLKTASETTVGQVLRNFRVLSKDKDVIMYFYIVDEEEKLLGVVDIREILQAKLAETLGNLMTTHVITLNPDSTLIEAARLFSRYSFRAIPVTDKEDTLLGVIPYRDVMNLRHRFVD